MNGANRARSPTTERLLSDSKCTPYGHGSDKPRPPSGSRSLLPGLLSLKPGTPGRWEGMPGRFAVPLKCRFLVLFGQPHYLVIHESEIVKAGRLPLCHFMVNS